MEFLTFGQTKLGSSLLLPANGLGGARTTSFLVVYFALQNTPSNPAKKNRAKPEKEKMVGTKIKKRYLAPLFPYFKHK